MKGFKSTILVVNDVIKSGNLYKTIFHMTVDEDHGIYNIGFTEGLSLYQRELFENISKLKTTVNNANSVVVYFEYDDLETIHREIEKYGLEFIHHIEEQPWGQLVFRVYDYDKNILEIAEDMTFCLKRLYNKNMSIKEIANKTGYTEELVLCRISGK